jgi:hypothetical protein
MLSKNCSRARSKLAERGHHIVIGTGLVVEPVDPKYLNWIGTAKKLDQKISRPKNT